MRITLTIIITCILCINVSGQGYFEKNKPHPYFISSELNYNTALQEFGIGARLERTLLKKFRVGIHSNYLTKINYSKDFYVGIRSSFWLLKSERKYAFRKYTYDSNRPDLYIFGQLDHNWYFLEAENKQISFTPFIGLGSSYGKSFLKYFIEVKYNVAFNEPWMSAGVTTNLYGFKNRKKFPQ